MPELPEVETVRRGIEKPLISQRLLKSVVRQPRLRWEIPQNFLLQIKNQTLQSITRRGKYLLLNLDRGSIIIHLGMSGVLRLLPESTHAQKHDHVDFIFANGMCLRYNDPRRFGSIHWVEDDPLQHPLLSHLGVEPLSREFSAAYLLAKTQKRQVPIKQLLMNSEIVVGVGNIYANEALYAAKIHPLMPARQLTELQAGELVEAIKKVLKKAIKAGGTTLKDFYASDGKPGYFSHELQVYDKKDESCGRCQTPIVKIVISSRATYFCPNCTEASKP